MQLQRPISVTPLLDTKATPSFSQFIRGAGGRYLLEVLTAVMFSSAAEMGSGGLARIRVAPVMSAG